MSEEKSTGAGVLERPLVTPLSFPETGHGAIVPAFLSDDAYKEGMLITREQLDALGLITPVAPAAMLRAAFAEKQRLYAAILDENDYIYTVSYSENGRTRQNIYTRKADADKAALAYNTTARASPKKSGIVKLAAALGIQSKRRQTRGLPDDPNASYSYVVYEASHPRTGRVEEGVGWCDTRERGGKISLHDVIATADTRAYNRAVLRLAGFGDVSADEIIAGANEDGQSQGSSQSTVVDVAPLKKGATLPPLTDEDVLGASRAWAEVFSLKDQAAPAPIQTTKLARELRARARRGDAKSARSLGEQGLTWEGSAQDDGGFEAFMVEAPPVTVQDVRRVRETATQQAKAAEAKVEQAKAAAPVANGNGPAKEPGWDLGSTGDSKNDDKNKGDLAATTRPAAVAGIPAPDPYAEAITNAQAKSLSEKLLAKTGTKEAAQAWLRANAQVERSLLVRSNQYDAVMKKLAESESTKGA